MADVIKYKGQLYKRVDNNAFDEGKNDLRKLYHKLGKKTLTSLSKR